MLINYWVLWPGLGKHNRRDTDASADKIHEKRENSLHFNGRADSSTCNQLLTFLFLFQRNSIEPPA